MRSLNLIAREKEGGLLTGGVTGEDGARQPGSPDQHAVAVKQ